MKRELVLIGTIMLLAQIEHQTTKVEMLKHQLHASNNLVSLISNRIVKENEHVFKYTEPFNVIKKTSPYGYREFLNPFTGGTIKSNHKGLDVVGQWHCEIKPIALNGVVIDVWPVPNWYYKGHELFGGYVRIEHNDGWISGYGHQSAIYVKEGDLLINGLFYREGKVIPSKSTLGRQGNTGISTGEHLHLSIQNNKGDFVDPLKYIDLRGVNND